MGSLILFVILFFLMLIAIPIINIIGVVRSVGKQKQSQQYQDQTTNASAATNQSGASPIHKRFDKSKAQDVESEEV